VVFVAGTETVGEVVGTMDTFDDPTGLYPPHGPLLHARTRK
jgi:hypothetical protein